MHDLHDLARSAKGADREAPADDLGESAQVGPDLVDGFGASPVKAQGLHFIEDKQRTVRTGGFPEKTKKPGAGGNDPRRPQNRLDYHRGELMAHLFQDLPAPVDVVVGQIHHQLGDQAGNTRRGSGGVVMRSVIASLEAADPGPSGVGAGQAHRRHGGLGSRVGEPHQLHGGDPFADHLRQPHLVFGRRREGRSPFRGFLGSLQNAGMGVPADQRRVIVEVVHPPVAVDVDDVAPLSPHLERGERREEGGGASGAARKHLLGAVGQLHRPGIGPAVLGHLPLERGGDL